MLQLPHQHLAVETRGRGDGPVVPQSVLVVESDDDNSLLRPKSTKTTWPEPSSKQFSGLRSLHPAVSEVRTSWTMGLTDTGFRWRGGIPAQG
jgi:hypothetical protein